MSFCPTKDIHSVYLDNELPENFKAEYELHVKNCPHCQKELEKIRSLHVMFSRDSDAITPDSTYLDQSFDRLQIKMAYSKNSLKGNRVRFINTKYMISAAAAAAVIAVVVPVRIKSSATPDVVNTSNFAVASTVNSVVPMTNVNNSAVSGNNVSFDSGRSVLVSGNIHETVLSSESKRRGTEDFTRNVRKSEVLRPELEDEAISIRITIPGVGDIPVVTEVNVPMGIMTGRF